MKHRVNAMFFNKFIRVSMLGQMTRVIVKYD